MKKTLQLLLVILMFSSCSSLKNSNLSGIKSKNHPNPNRPERFSYYKVDNTFDKKQNILFFIQEKASLKLKITSFDSEYTTVGLSKIYKDNAEVYSSYNNSLYNIQDMKVGDFDEIFITKKGFKREVYLYTLKQ